MMPPTSIDGTDITGATIDGSDVQEITVDGQTVFTAQTLPVAYSNLVAWYPFDSATYGGSNADDVTAIIGGSGDDTAYDGTVTGATYESSGGVTDIDAGANSGYYSFDGTDFIETPFDLDTQSAFTIMAFARFDTLSSDNGILYMNSNPERLYLWFTTFRNQIEAGLGDFDDLTFLSQANMNTNQWYHVALSYDGTTFRSYVDGGTTPTDTSTINVPEATGDMYIGNLFNTDFMNGDIDDVRVYNTDLSGSQINQIYTNTKP